MYTFIILANLSSYIWSKLVSPRFIASLFCTLSHLWGITRQKHHSSTSPFGETGFLNVHGAREVGIHDGTQGMDLVIRNHRRRNPWHRKQKVCKTQRGVRQWVNTRKQTTCARVPTRKWYVISYTYIYLHMICAVILILTNNPTNVGRKKTTNPLVFALFRTRLYKCWSPSFLSDTRPYTAMTKPIPTRRSLAIVTVICMQFVLRGENLIYIP